MKRKNHDWSAEKLYKERTRISFPEYQREKLLWSLEKKSLLIDSMLQGIDIPKLYFNFLKDDTIEVIDGQQRIWTIWQFLDDGFPYIADGKKTPFSKLPAADQTTIKEYVFQITGFNDADEDYLRLLFVRLQLGLLLVTGEKLHAATGKMKDFVFETLSNHPFIRRVSVSEKRFAKPTLCAQAAINSFARQKGARFARTRYDDLAHFFDEYAAPKGKDLELFGKQTRHVVEVFDQLGDCFGDTAQNLKNRSYILSIILFVEDLIKQGKFGSKERAQFREFAFKLWERLKEEGARGIDRTNRELYGFDGLLSSAPGEAYQIERRHIKLGEFFDHYKKTKKILGDR